MRICLVLSLLAALFLAGCGGDEMKPADGSGGTDATKAPDAGAADQPPAKKRARLSQDATLVKNEWTMVKNISDYEKKKATAIEKAKANAYRADDAQLYVGYIYKIAEDPAGAAKAFKRFADGCPDSVNCANALYEAGAAFVNADNVGEAEVCLKTLLTSFPAKTKLIRALGLKVGQGYAASGDFEKATTYLKEASDGGNVMASLQLIQLNWIRGDFDGARSAAAKYVETNAGAKPKERERAKVYNEIAKRCGTPAKEFDIEGWSGNVDFDESELKGKVYIVYFWKMPSWPNAVKTTRLMASFHKKYAGKGLKIVGLNKPYGLDPTNRNAGSGRDLTAEEELTALRVWGSQEDYGVAWPLGLTQGDADHDWYGWWSGSIPCLSLVDKQGRLRFVQHGVGALADPNPLPFFRAAIEKCLKE